MFIRGCILAIQIENYPFIYQPVFTEHLVRDRHWARLDDPPLNPLTGPVHEEQSFSLLFSGGRGILRSIILIML